MIVRNSEVIRGAHKVSHRCSSCVGFQKKNFEMIVNAVQCQQTYKIVVFDIAIIIVCIIVNVFIRLIVINIILPDFKSCHNIAIKGCLTYSMTQ